VTFRLLCVVVENTTTTLGCFDDDLLTGRWHLSTDGRRTPDEWQLLLSGLLASAGGRVVDGVCLCSAVPSVLHVLRRVMPEMFPSAHTVVLGPGVRTGLSVLMDNPREVGTDRIANCVAAVHLAGSPCIVVDLGTATTFDVVSDAGQYVGGVIAPGLEISLEALDRHGAQLRQVEIARPRSVVAKNTVEALQAGALYGCAGQVDGIVGRILREMSWADDRVPVLATGLLAEPVVHECQTVTRFEPNLTLQGLRVVFARNV
jgi:type III pantothenate kinase